MVDSNKYKEDIDKIRAELAQDDLDYAKKMDEENSDVLLALSDALGVKIRSFDDLTKLPWSIVYSNIGSVIRVLDQVSDTPIRNYSVSHLFWGRKQQLEEWMELYELSFSRRGMQAVRYEVAAKIFEEMQQDVEKFVDFLERQPNTYAKVTLLYGILKIKNKKMDDRFKQILKKSLKHSSTFVTAAEVIRKKKYTELLEDVRRALPMAGDDRVQKSEIEKTIRVLEKLLG